jgi:hypothetical protein
MRDWRREARHTALEGLLAGTLRFTWGRGATEGEVQVDEADQPLWESLMEGALTEEA